MARTRWPPGSVNPASCTGRADQTGIAGGCQKSLGPGRQIDSQDNQQASADSQAKPGPRPDPTPPPSQNTGSRAEPTTYILPADYALCSDDELALAERHRRASYGAVPFAAVAVLG